MHNPEKLAAYVTQDEDKQNKNTVQYVLDTTMRKNTNNVNKTWALLQTTAGKDEYLVSVLFFDVSACNNSTKI